MNTTRAPYSGSSRKFILALDIGTTFSGAAYAFLDPGQVPEIRPVTKYLDCSNVGSAKVPSAFYYDREGKFCGIENGVDLEDNNGLLRMKWWKLMLSPSTLPAAMTDQMSTELPEGKTTVDVFADFMRYLFHSTRELFKDLEPNGELRWNSISESIELVLTHPNGWGGPQQAQLRNAAVKAGIVQDTPAGRSRVHFVTEGEASFNFCAANTEAGKNLKPGEQVLIIDAGGGTIDISTYKVLSSGPLRVEELYEPKCLVEGGELVTATATDMVKKQLKFSEFNTSEDMAAFSQRFDEGLKKIFSVSSSHTDQYVRFLPPKYNDPSCGIKSGKLRLTGAQISGFFESSIQSTVDSIRDNFRQRLPENSIAFLVGGFATSPWVSEKLKQRLSDLGFQFCRPDTHTAKAVAIGAVSYYVDHFVKTRISKFTIGVFGGLKYKSSNPEHAQRADKSYINAMGVKRIRGHFNIMLTRGTKVLEDREVRLCVCRSSEDDPPRQAFPRIARYTGALATPEWEDVEPDKFYTLCNVTADISSAPHASKVTKTGKMSYKRDFDIILLVGLTELKAQVSWIDPETRTEKRSDAVVIYDDRL